MVFAIIFRMATTRGDVMVSYFRENMGDIIGVLYRSTFGYSETESKGITWCGNEEQLSKVRQQSYLVVLCIFILKHYY
uniref:Transmembrane protein n=1 Tax=Heterorhabditis bacteriophora TaxID=37862 RepID=A0A1I7W9J2_HETBA